MLPRPRILSDALTQRLSQLIYRCLEDLGSTKAALYLVDPATRAFDLVSHYGWPRTLPPPERLAPQDPFLVLVSREKRGFTVNDPRSFPELAAFGQGSASPRFHISPIYDHGEWKGILIQRDPSKGGTFNSDMQEGPVQAICEEIIQALNAFPLDILAEPVPVKDLHAERQGPGRMVPGEVPAVPPEEIPPIRVPAPPSGAMAHLEAPATHPEGEALEKILLPTQGVTSTQPAPSMRLPALLSESPQDPFQDIPSVEAQAFIPEQQTFFWEAAGLLCQMVPTAAVALWLSDGSDARPLLIYSRFPLSSDLKHQIISQTLAQSLAPPQERREDFKVLTKSEWFERDPIAGHFVTMLPVLLEEEAGGDNLLMLFRLEDRPFTMHEQELVRQVSRMLGFYLQEAHLHERYHQAFLSVSHRILASAEGRIPSLKAHSVNTAELSRDLARKLDLPTTQVEAVSISAILHDVGTLLLDYRILDKPRLSPDEMAKVRTHPLLASTFLKDLYFPFDVLNIIRHHHEQWDGSGYPDHLKGEEIPIGSRIIHLVEAYEMMISETPYRPAKTLGEAVAEMERLAGVQFDPFLVGQFLQILKARR